MWPHFIINGSNEDLGYKWGFDREDLDSAEWG